MGRLKRPAWVMRASDDFCFNPQSNVGGNGAYLNISDRRAKANIVPTSKGLAEVCYCGRRVRPRQSSDRHTARDRFCRAGRAADRTRGSVAGWHPAARRPPAGLDSSDPTLALSEATITAITVTAIQELNALIVSLTDRIAALEAAP